MKIYLSGPMYECSADESNNWRRQIKEAFPEHTFLDPVDEGYTEKDHPTQYVSIVEGDLQAIDNCDLVIAHVHKPSIGTAMELFYAFSSSGASTLVISTIPHAWLFYTADCIVDTVEAAIMALKHLPLDKSRMMGLQLGTVLTGGRR
jgi:hypothetical protein